MRSDLQRPDAADDPRRGLLHAEHFQIAYATNDMERALGVFRDRFGVNSWRRLEGPLRTGGVIRVELAWVGRVMYEVLTASGPGSAIYMDGLAGSDGFVLKHHHLGHLLQHEEDWTTLVEEIGRAGAVMAHESETPGFMRSCFVKAPEFGHYLEYMLPAPAGLALLQSVPGN